MLERSAGYLAERTAVTFDDAIPHLFQLDIL